LIYGVIEIVVAVVIMIVALNDAWEKLIMYFPVRRPDTSLVYVFPWLPTLVPILQILAATYVFVRGLDNIGEGIDAKSRIGRRWNAIFPKAEK
jgi:hypothetical protein